MFVSPAWYPRLVPVLVRLHLRIFIQCLHLPALPPLLSLSPSPGGSIPPSDWLASLHASPLPPFHIVIVNRGAHFKPLASFLPELRATLARLRALLPSALLIFRSTPPGHLNCSAHDVPLPARQPPEGLPFHWGEFGAENEAARREVEAVGGVYLDVEGMTALRADGHVGRNRKDKVDCLHYCLPGPVDTWTQLLFNMLVDLL